MRSFLIAIVAATALTVLVVGPASAHAGLMPGQVVPGGTLEAQMVLAHGCGPEGAVPASDEETFPTTAVTLEVPDELSIRPGEADGWTLTPELDAAGRVLSARWEAEDEAGAPGAVRFDVVVDATDIDGEHEVWLPIVQDCVEDEQLRWTLPDVDERDGQLPAMRVFVTAAAAEHDSSDGRPSWVIAALAAGGGVVGFVLFSRRG